MKKNNIEKNSDKTKSEDKNEKDAISEIQIPNIKELTKDEILDIYREELKKKDKIISELKNENRLLFDLTMKNAKRKLEEIEQKIDNSSENK